jgi:hypothetical protein
MSTVKTVTTVLKKIWVVCATLFFIFVLFVILFGAKNITSVVYSAKADGAKYITGAVIARAPARKDDNSGGIVFSQTQITLEVGESAYIQWSVVDEEGRQHNLQMNLLYDADKIKLEQNPDDMVRITALKEGETEINTFTNDGFIDVAYINILPKKDGSNDE